MENWADFHIIWEGGRALLEGRSPYSVADFFYPLPFVYFIAILALLPVMVALVVWLAANAAFFVAVFRKRFWHWLFYFPVLHLLLSGQNELLWWGLALFLRRGTGSAALAAFMTFKPQTAVILLPYHLWRWLRKDRRTLLQFVGFTALFWGLPLLWAPNWFAEWRGATRLEDDPIGTFINSPGIFSLLAVDERLLPVLVVIAVTLVIWGLLQKHEAVTRAALTLASPVGLFYTQMSLLGAAPAWLLVPLSLLAMVGTLLVVNWIPFLLVPLAVIIWHKVVRKPQPEGDGTIRSMVLPAREGRKSRETPEV